MRWTTCSEEQLGRVAVVLERTFGVELLPLEDQVLRACRKHLPRVLADASVQSITVVHDIRVMYDQKRIMYTLLNDLAERLEAVLSEDKVELLLDPKFEEGVKLLRERMS